MSGTSIWIILANRLSYLSTRRDPIWVRHWGHCLVWRQYSSMHLLQNLCRQMRTACGFLTRSKQIVHIMTSLNALMSISYSPWPRVRATCSATEHLLLLPRTPLWQFCSNYPAITWLKPWGSSGDSLLPSSSIRGLHTIWYKSRPINQKNKINKEIQFYLLGLAK